MFGNALEPIDILLKFGRFGNVDSDGGKNGFCPVNGLELVFLLVTNVLVDDTTGEGVCIPQELGVGLNCWRCDLCE